MSSATSEVAMLARAGVRLVDLAKTSYDVVVMATETHDVVGATKGPSSMEEDGRRRLLANLRQVFVGSQSAASFWAVWVTPGVTRAAFGSSALRRGVRALPTSEPGPTGRAPPGVDRSRDPDMCRPVAPPALPETFPQTSPRGEAAGQNRAIMQPQPC